MPMTLATHPRPSDTAQQRPGAASTAPEIRHFAGLDGLRGLAVAAVVVFHVFPGVLPGGFIGVDVFFVISGFLITSLLVSEHRSTGRINLIRFWQRRARRLLPALVTLVLVCSTAAWIIGGDILVGIGRQILGAATFSSNWLAIASDTSYFSQGSPDLFRNLWSLAVEEQFYLVWPLLLLAALLIRHARIRLGLVCLIAIASGAAMALLYQPGADATRVYFGSDTHCFGLAIGAALALIVRQIKPLDLDAGESGLQIFVRKWLPPLGVISLIALGFAAWWLHDGGAATYRGGLVVVSVLAALVIWAAVSRHSSLGAGLDSAPLRVIGVRSYGIYLWHWPVFILVQAALASADPWRTPWFVGTLTIAVTLALSALSYRFIEQPIRRSGLRGTGAWAVRKLRTSRVQRPLVIAVIAAIVLGSSSTIAAAASAPAETHAQDLVERGQHAIAAAKAKAKEPTVPLSPLTPLPSVTPTPTPTAPQEAGLPAGARITAVGDSVMLASAPELQAAFPGISIDAVVSRSMYAAPSILQSLADAGALRPVILLGLGTNGPIDPDSMRAVKQIAGPDREIVLVNVQAPRDWTAGVNAELSAFAAANPATTTLADWQTAIAGHLGMLAGDRIHPGSAGGQIYVSAVKAAMQRFADHARIRANQREHGPQPR